LGRISQHTDRQTEYFLTDALGSVRQLVNEDGQLTLAKSYTPYGETLSSVGSGSSMFAFTGEAMDDRSLIYLRARYYAPGTGRFTQIDPSQLEANLYLYAAANPINRVDPSEYWNKATCTVADVSCSGCCVVYSQPRPE
jgi:RHS repeat-associated protein